MKKIISILLSILMILGMIPISAFAEETAATTYTIPELEGKYKTQGRTVVLNNILMTDYTATGMEFNAYCSGDVSVTFKATKFKAENELGGCYYTIIVDGVQKSRDFCHITATGDTTVKIAEGLEEGNHNFEIYRQGEIDLATIGIKSVTLKGEVLMAPRNNDMYIEFVGASQWGGYGNLATNSTPSSDVFTAKYEDGTNALTYLTAKALGADWSIVSIQGIGAYWGWQPTSMETVYKYLRYSKDKNTLYDFARQPDYVVIGLGTNDYSRMNYYNKTTDDLVNSFVDFISLVRQKNPKAKIIWACNMMTSDVNPYVKSAVEKSGGDKKGVYSVTVTMNRDGGGNHPSVAGHQVMAKEISAFISDLEKENILIESDFSKDSKWVANPDIRVSAKDDNGDGVNDYWQFTTDTVAKYAFIASNTATLVPGKEYMLSFCVRVPSDSAEYVATLSDGTVKKIAPKYAIYQPQYDSATGKVTSFQIEGQNDYAYDYGGKNGTIVRRSAFTSNWNIGDYPTYLKEKYSIFGPSHYNACNNLSPNVVYADWTKITATFTAIDDENNVGPQVVALSLGLPSGVADLKLDVKDVVLKVKGYDNSADNEEVPDDTETPNDAILYEDFEDVSDPTTIINDVLNQNWVKPQICTTDFVSGSKSVSIFGMYQNILVPLDKMNFVDNKIYEFSLNWKLNAYTTTKKRELSSVQLIGWNPSEGNAFKSSYKKLSGNFTAIKGTGDWVNTAMRFKWLEEFAQYEQVAMRIYYSSSTPYDSSEDTIYIDDLKIELAEDQSYVPLNLNEAERTKDTIKVLAFGNSFSNDSTAFIDDIAIADGTDLRVADCSIGGCSLERHYGNSFNGACDYSFTYRTINGSKSFSNVNMIQALTATDWDYITIQQVSGNSGLIDTFEPYLNVLLDYFKEHCPNAKVLFHTTWAYAQNSTHPDFPKYDKNQEKMHTAIQNTYLKVSQKYGYVPLIPTGEAIRLARASSMGDNFNRDGYHLNDKGRLIASLTWYETFTGISALDTKVDLSKIVGTVGDTKDVVIGVTADEALIMKTAAHRAASTFKKANETQLAIEAIGTVNETSGPKINKALSLRAELNNDALLPNLETLTAAVDAYSKLDIAVLAGDIDASGVVDLNDVVILAQHVAGWNVLVKEATVDVNGDKSVDLNDVVHLAQYVAGWEGIELHTK